jgi:predicted transport protein
MPLYQIDSSGIASQIKPTSYNKERQLQKFFEKNLEKLLGVRFIASEFYTGDRQRGRIDSLGIDQDGSPTIIEYKRTSKENIINQGLFYMDWLVDHKGDFTLAAQQTLGTNIEINWTQPRLILIAETFTDYDKYAVNRIGANIELWVFHRYGENYIYLDPIFTTNGKSTRVISTPSTETETNEIDEEVVVYSLSDHKKGKTENIIELFEVIREKIFALAEDNSITEKPNKMYICYKHGKNFCEIRIQSKALWMWLDIPKNELDDPLDKTRDVTDIGHYGTGQVDLKIYKEEEVDYVMRLIEQSFQLTI